MDQAATWQVNGAAIHQTTTLGPGGQGIITVYVVPYVITSGPASGAGGTVEIAPAQYNPADVTAAINAIVNATHSVAGLSG